MDYRLLRRARGQGGGHSAVPWRVSRPRFLSPAWRGTSRVPARRGTGGPRLGGMRNREGRRRRSRRHAWRDNRRPGLPWRHRQRDHLPRGAWSRHCDPARPARAGRRTGNQSGAAPDDSGGDAGSRAGARAAARSRRDPVGAWRGNTRAAHMESETGDRGRAFHSRHYGNRTAILLRRMDRLNPARH